MRTCNEPPRRPARGTSPMISFRPLPLMTLFALLGLLLALVLGSWQWERYQTKLRLAHTPVAERTVENYQPMGEGMQFVFGVRNNEPGWRVFTPVHTGDATVFVDDD